jgi:FAD synthase
MLGHAFSITGKIIHGLKNGRAIGFPTINIPITSTITLKKQDWVVPASYPFISGDIVPFMAEKTLSWKVV